MQHLTVLGLLLACAVSLSSCGIALENGEPILWANSVSQLTDFPTQNGVVAPNPWNYLQRMGFYRLLIAYTDPFMGSMGTNATDSPLWGLPLQLAWTKTSERFADPTGTTTCGQQTVDPLCISTQSWWSCVNYFVSALPFLSAAKQGVFGADVQVELQAADGVEGFCTNYNDCLTRYQDAMTKWDSFFEGLKNAMLSPLPDNEKKDALLGLYWTAQMASTYASAMCKPRQSHYSPTEVSFQNSWQNSAEYVAAAHFQSNLENAARFIAPLPSRVLQATDIPPNIADLSPEENNTLRVFSWMNRINSLLAGSLVRTWKGAMCSVTTREKGRELLTVLLLDSSAQLAMPSFLSILSGMSSSC